MSVVPVMRPWLGDEEGAAAAEAIASGWVAQGPRVAAFEAAFANRIDAAHGAARQWTRKRLRPEALRAATAVLGRTTSSPEAFNEARRELLWWSKSRMQAARSQSRTMLRGSGLCVAYSGYVELVPLDVPGPGQGQVTVRSEVSAINVGTERAQYLRLPNASRIDGSQPVGSMGGVVAAVGRGVNNVKVGQRVAVAGVPHSSIVTVPADSVVAIPDGVTFTEAALVHHATIAGQGVRLAELARGDSFGMVGLGIIGAVTLRLAIAEGGCAEAVVATSQAKAQLARDSGAKTFLTTSEDDAAIASLELPIVFEVTGDPQALETAVRMTAPGGRLVLLGSSRGITEAMPVGLIRAKGLTLVGAHVGTIRRQAQQANGNPSRDGERRAAERYLELVATGKTRFTDLFTRICDPREAPVLYRDIVDDRNIVGAALDWTCLPDRDRLARSNILRPPSLTGRGVNFDESRSRRVRRSSGRAIVDFPDPLEGASGHLRFGMLGCGDISRHNARAIAAAPNAELVACFDPVAELSQDISDAYGAERLESAHELIRHSEVDAVFISVPHHLHEPLALMAIEEGRHVVVEKPLSTDVRSAMSIVQAAERAGVTLSTCFPQRYDPAVIAARQLVDEGALGELSGSHVRVLIDKPPAYWYGGYSGRSHSTWRSSRERAGGGVLIMNACHYVDMVRHLAGTEVSAISALSSTVDGDMEVEDSITVALRYANGAIGSIVASSGVRGTTSSGVQVWGRDGHIVVEPRGRFFSFRYGGAGRTSRWHHFEGLPTINGRTAYVSRLATAIDRCERPDVSAADGLAVQAIIEAAYRSAETGTVVDPAGLLADARQ